MTRVRVIWWGRHKDQLFLLIYHQLDARFGLREHVEHMSILHAHQQVRSNLLQLLNLLVFCSFSFLRLPLAACVPQPLALVLLNIPFLLILLIFMPVSSWLLILKLFSLLPSLISLFQLFLPLLSIFLLLSWLLQFSLFQPFLPQVLSPLMLFSILLLLSLPLPSCRLRLFRYHSAFSIRYL